MAQKQYRASGTKGAFKQYDIGAQAQLRAMREQVTPILNAHKRNAEAIFAEQNRHLSAIQRAQSDEEQNRKSNQGFEIDKLNNIQKQHQKRANELGRYASEGYNEIMSQAIQMSEFSKWSQTFLKVAEGFVQAGVKAGIQQSQANAAQNEADTFLRPAADNKIVDAETQNTETTKHVIEETNNTTNQELANEKNGLTGDNTLPNIVDPLNQSKTANPNLGNAVNTARVTTIAQEAQLLSETAELMD